MKKLFSLGTMITILFVLVACGSDPEADMASITVQLNSNEGLVEETINYDENRDETLIDLLETTFSLGYEDRDGNTYLTKIGDLKTSTNVALEFYLNDDLIETSIDNIAFEDGDVFNIRRVWFDGDARLGIQFETARGTMKETFRFDSNTDNNLFEMLQAAYTLEYQDYDGFVFLKELAHIKPTQGAFIETSRNNFTLETSINAVTFSDGDVFNFKHTWFLTGPRLVYEALELFIDEQLEQYITETPNHYIFLGLYHMGLLENYDFKPASITEDFTSGDFVKNILIANVLELDYEPYQAGLLDIAELVHPYTDSMVAIALSDYEPASGFIDDYLAYVENKPLEEMDYDTLSIVFVALNILDENLMLQLDIREHLLEAPYGHTYGYNAATLAQTLLVFGQYFDVPGLKIEGENLLERLLAHQTADGAFRYELDAEDADTLFTSPQAFFALAYVHGQINHSEDNPFAWE